MSLPSEPQQPSTTGNTAPTYTRVQLGGFAGSQMELLFFPVFNEPDPRNAGGPDGLPGQYTVTFTLHRPTSALTSDYVSESAEVLEGDSHVVMSGSAAAALRITPASELVVPIATPAGRLVFRGAPNNRGVLGRIRVDPFEASSFADAESRSHQALASLLSTWALWLDVPLRIFQIESCELRRGSTKRSFVKMFLDAPLVTTEVPTTQPFRGYAALYREALNSNSPLYQFLCLYKILEGIRVLRSRLGIKAKKQRQAFRRPEERIPKEPASFVPWLASIFPGWTHWNEAALNGIFRPNVLGKKVGQVIDDHLRPLRREIAHLFSDTGEMFSSLDDSLHYGEVQSWLPLTRCLARLLIKNEFADQMIIPPKLAGASE